MYNGSQYCHTKSRLDKEKISVGGSLKNSNVNNAILALNGVVKRSRA